jgi:uncharacterized membrane protein
MQALWTVPLDSFLVAGSSGRIDKTVESLKLSVRLFSCPHRLYSGTTIAQVALWVIRKDLYPIRYWVIGNNDSSICTLGNRDVSCPIEKWVNGVMRTDLDPKVKCVQGKGALQARFLAMRSKDRWAPRQLAS